MNKIKVIPIGKSKSENENVVIGQNPWRKVEYLTGRNSLIFMEGL